MARGQLNGTTNPNLHMSKYTEHKIPANSVRIHRTTMSVMPRVRVALITPATLLCLACALDSSPTVSAAAVGAASVDLAIGQEDGDEPYTFGRISGVEMDAAGRIYVLDNQAAEVRVFDTAGRHVETFGQRGEGPGELQDPCCLAIGPGNRLWVRDNGNNRYVSFVLEGERGRAGPSMRMSHTDVNRWGELTFDEAGNLIDIGSRYDTIAKRSRTLRFHVAIGSAPTAEAAVIPVPEAPEGAVAVAQIPYERPNVRGVRYVYQPYGPMHLVAHGPRGVFATAISGAYMVQVHAPDGSVVRTIGVPGTAGPLLTAAQRASGDSNLARTAQFVGKKASELPFTVPERNVPLSALSFDDRGRLWVFLSTPPDSARLVHVYDNSGVHVETLTLPQSVTFGLTSVIRGDRIVATATDSLGVPRVVRLTVR